VIAKRIENYTKNCGNTFLVAERIDTFANLWDNQPRGEQPDVQAFAGG
jgi:hypothetical protein